MNNGIRRLRRWLAREVRRSFMEMYLGLRAGCRAISRIGL